MKRILDLVCSAAALITSAPLMLVIAIAIKLDSRGPVFFRQTRLGRNGRPFLIVKFRTMVDNAENMEAGIFNYAGDTRVTRVGKILRKTSLDELPQLYNILKGDMSFVGPRPPLTYELGNYEDFPDDLKRRFCVRPGVTGLAQVSGRNELSWDEKIKYDLEYIEKLGTSALFLDLKIILLTVAKVILMKGSYELPENAEKDAARMAKRRDSH